MDLIQIRVTSRSGVWFELYDGRTRYVAKPNATKAVMDLYRHGQSPASLLPLLTDTEKQG